MSESSIVQRVKKLSELEFVKTSAIARMTGLVEKPSALNNLVSRLHGKRDRPLSGEEAGRIIIAFEEAYNILGKQLGLEKDDQPWNCRCKKCGARFLKSQGKKQGGELICVNEPECSGRGDDVQTFK